MSDFEPLAALARFAWENAPRLCDPAHACAGYHRLWSMIRLLELDGAPPAGAGFFRHELERLPGAPRILISGAADSGLVALVAAGLGTRMDTATLVVADRCATPLEQNRRFAAARGLRVELRQGDVRALDCAPVDAVVAHTFLPFFAAAVQAEVVQTWARLLKPGGRLLMSNRLATERGLPPPRPDAAVTAARLERLRQGASAAGWEGSELAVLLELAEEFWNDASRHRLAEAELREILQAAGLELETLAYEDVVLPTGPLGHLAAGRRRADIVARKPV